MRIFLDAMGGDNAPQAPVEGAIEALRRFPALEITLAGVMDQLTPLVKDCADVRDRITLLDAPEIITNDESPVMGVRTKKNSATVIGMLQLRDKQVDGFVTAGSTGATLAGGIFRLGRIPGIERPALAPLMPNGKGHFLLIDCGANVDCQSDWLVQFGIMGDAYMRGVMGMKEPRVGLINIGAESEKGNKLVCDGFSGNLVLKFMEGVAGTLMGIIKQELLADTRGKIGALISKPAFKRVKKAMDYTEVGGAPLLGVEGAVTKAHGSSNGHAIACAIAQCIKMVDGHVVDIIRQGVQQTLSQA